MRHGLAAAALLLVACAGPQHVAHLVPAFPTREQSPYATMRDRETCDQVARTRPDGFAYQSACLIAKGYRTYVSVRLAGLGYMQFLVVRAADQPSIAGVLADLTECGREAGGTIERRSGSEALAGGSTMSRASQDVAERPFLACLVPRGYAAERWAP